MSSKEEWNVQKILHWTTYHFAGKKISSARLDAELLLSYALGCQRIDLYMRFDQPMHGPELEKFRELVKRRALHEPVAYIIGHQEFYGRKFIVGPGCLIPRPETEHIVDEAKVWVREHPQDFYHVLDVATGSGCLAATLALEFSSFSLTAVDVSPGALQFARENFKRLGVESRVHTHCQDFLEWTKTSIDKFDLIVCNPPYISRKSEIMEDVVKYEPAQALFGGEEGTELIFSWLPLLVEKVKPDGEILVEIGFDQRASLENHLKDFKDIASLKFVKDYSGHDRVLKIIKKK